MELTSHPSQQDVKGLSLSTIEVVYCFALSLCFLTVLSIKPLIDIHFKTEAVIIETYNLLPVFSSFRNEMWLGLQLDALYIIFWFIIGSLTYLLFWSIYRIIHDTRTGLVSSKGYKVPIGRLGAIRASNVVRYVVLKSLTFILLGAFTITTLLIVFPLSSDFIISALSSIDWLSIPIALLSFTVSSVSLLSCVVLYRLFKSV
jgi:hypothetical protein